jgi:hypothetical protein
MKKTTTLNEGGGGMPPTCPIHGRVLLCPACIGAKGGAQRTEAQQRQTKRAQRARKAAAKARRDG